MSIRAASASDLPDIIKLLEQARLPASDLAAAPAARFWIAEHDGVLLGAVGLERHGDEGLLRSLVVAPQARGHGTGAALVQAVEAAAREQGLQHLVLLTQTAREFFEQRGYTVVDRGDAPDAVQSSSEFQSLCPASAVCMVKTLSRPIEVLFLCTGNSCRSILGEATFNHLAPPGWHAMSAGSRPTGEVHPRSLALLQREGIATHGYHSKSWDHLPAAPEIVITVCASAAGEACPVYLGPVLRTHWGVDDPAHATGTDAEIDTAFEKAYRTLRRRIEAFFALPLAQLVEDRGRLKDEMDRIGQTVE